MSSTGTLNELREGPFDGEWIMYAPGRARIGSLTDDPERAQERACPFCPGAPEVGDGYEICILPNRYPSFVPEGEARRAGPARREGYGRQDVFLFSDAHDGRLSDQRPQRVEQLLHALGQRIDELYRDPKIEFVAAFENSGPEFGPSIAHPHGQIFALPFVPKRALPRTPHCAICRALEEGDYAPGQIASSETAVLVCPPYARFPYEMHVLPRRHVPLLSSLEAATLGDMSRLLGLGLRALRAIGRGWAPYMLLIHTAPRSLSGDYHLRVEIVPLNKSHGGRKYLGGLELGFGVFVNPSVPEAIAAELRGVLCDVLGEGPCGR